MLDSLALPHGTLDLARGRFVPAEGAPVGLTTREVALLRYLAEHAGRDVSRDDLLGSVWGHHELSLSRAVDTTVTRLRRKIEPDPSAPETLCTAHGHGYRLVLPGPAAPTVPVVPEARVLVLGERRVDLAAGRVLGESGAVALTCQERRILDALAGHGVVPFDRLARAAGIAGRPALSNAIWRLRGKIEPDPDDPRWLVGVRGLGYRLDTEVVSPRPGLDALSRTLWTVADQAATLLGLHDCVLYALDGTHLVQVAAHGPKAPEPGAIQNPIALRIGEGIVGTAARTQAAQCVADVRVDPRYVRDAVPARSELAVPIVHQGDLVGVLDSESPAVAAYGAHHRGLFEAFAQVAAAAVSDVQALLARRPA